MKKQTLSDKEIWVTHRQTNQECYAFPKKDVKEFIKELKEKVLTNWKGQNEFVDWIDRKIGEEK
jgi:hypothetical protein